MRWSCASATAARSASWRVDLNDFKLVNDNLGHPVGDELLIGVASRLLNAVRSGDTVARLGGDEFSIVVEGSANVAHLIAHRVAEAFERPFLIADARVADAPQRRAGDRRARRAEPGHRGTAQTRRRRDVFGRRGRGCAVCRPITPRCRRPPSTSTGDVRQGHRARRRAAGWPRSSCSAIFGRPSPAASWHCSISRKFDLTTARIVGVEALLRWPREDGQLAEPDDFLPLVRRHGLMASVTDFVLNRALDDAASWQAASVDVPLAVNLFAPSLANLELPRDDQPRAGRSRAEPWRAHARDHRGSAARQHRTHPDRAGRIAAQRDSDRHRRLRHRLLGVVLPA